MGKNAATKRSYKWPITIGLVVGVLFVTLFTFAYNLPKVFKYESDSKQVNLKKENKTFSSLATYDREENSPYLKTGFDNIFYTVEDSSTIRFATFKGKGFSEVKSSGNFTVSLPTYFGTIKVKVFLVEKDGKTEGYGVYKNLDSLTCPYLFLRLTECKKFAKDGYLIFTDYSIPELYKNDKTYSMAYYLKAQNESPIKLFSEKGITVGRDGLPSQGFILLTDDYINNRAGTLCFLSDRNYESGKQYDLYIKRDIDSDEEIFCSGVSAPYLFYNGGSTYFLSKNDDSSFSLCKAARNKKVTIRSFNGIPSSYAVCGNYIFSPATKTLYDLFSDYQVGVSTSISISGVQSLDVNADGKKLALAGNFVGNSEKLLFAEFSTGNARIVDGENLFLSGTANVTFLGDSVYLLKSSKEDKGVTNFIVPWDAIFSMK